MYFHGFPREIFFGMRKQKRGIFRLMKAATERFVAKCRIREIKSSFFFLNRHPDGEI